MEGEASAGVDNSDASDAQPVETKDESDLIALVAAAIGRGAPQTSHRPRRMSLGAACAYHRAESWEWLILRGVACRGSRVILSGIHLVK